MEKHEKHYTLGACLQACSRASTTPRRSVCLRVLVLELILYFGRNIWERWAVFLVFLLRVLNFFCVWRVWRIQVNLNPVVSASTICVRARDLLEVLVSFEMFRHASVVHNECWSDVGRVFEYHHFWLQISDNKNTTSCLWIWYLVPSRRIQHHWLLPHSHREAKEKFFHDAWNPSNVPRFQNHLGSSTPRSGGGTFEGWCKYVHNPTVASLKEHSLIMPTYQTLNQWCIYCMYAYYTFTPNFHI